MAKAVMRRGTAAFAKRGTTVLELVTILAVATILAGIVVLNLTNRKRVSELSTTTVQIVALLREAQSRSMSQASGASWGVHFENATTSAPAYALFAASYSPSTRTGYYRLSPFVGYAASSIPPGASKDVIFSQLTGTAASTTISLYLRSTPDVSSTIRIASSGAVTY
ncbi:MAG: hypothetical protein A3A43_01750 [Candidatus Liptonbacteria bacterium RIFCSPLOWO2_01_FULL_56_20]|uniref:General secretion pathway GspH domain-containing protein n=1 Tax=Candidatus Liptonbacteria bacterium RIFCSPLOWO2_01_FULL_56_20 TaxID=1798652 RepID=A0A1G2CK70_9BACT|nr:MAG: hypothetical protein UY96_C0001G0014 [Parcubacteria group bacterium GW2011_GWB1_56_8]OGY97651.1 MAG: hypothetical protein A2681_02990 [Candidatus Liptonbacteria bacterium RIFCSPHIGHO2_01_FULL_56_18b]OGZ01612.1 MAG: hypothetical protein A3A43_01750 [Candidatus Liptonbacteria bacterium RIFCSPLOWO2_01_FULL_56_20]